MPKQFTIGKAERLKSRKQIGQLFNDGKHFVLMPFRVYYIINTSAQPIANCVPPIASAVAQGLPMAQRAKGVSMQMGAGVSVRNFKKAVDRNRVKRLVREGYRLQKNSLQQALKEKHKQLHFFIIYTGKELPGHKEIFPKVNQVLIKLEKIIRDDT